MTGSDPLADHETPRLTAVPKARHWPFAVAGLLIIVLYATHFAYCQRSTLPYLDVVLRDSDMSANLHWAENIREQGWLDAHPYHPYTGWMQAVAPYAQWVKWWGGEKIFQQSPLYAYILALFVHRSIWMRVLQALLSVGTCVFLGLATARMSGRRAGWIAFWLAALYAPFYVYAWPFLRDGLGWFITAALVWLLSELTHSEWSSDHARFYAWAVGALLGLGLLAKESYLLLVPLTWVTLGAFAWKRGHWGVVTRVAIATLLTISPLLVRNALVGAPLLSSSNRFAETFVQGNAGTAHPYLARIPAETGQILNQTQGRTWPLLRAIIASHPDGLRGFLKLQFRKFLSLFDPYESPDNLSFYFVAYVSPVVRFGLRYWMVLPAALAGLFLSIWRRERAHVWVWALLPVFFANLFIGIPLSRYRQSLMIFLIPLAGYFLAQLVSFIGRRQFRTAAYCGVAVLVGWGLILGPLSRQPRAQYERRMEYLYSAQILYRLGERQKEQAMEDVIRKKFPGFLASDSGSAPNIK